MAFQFERELEKAAIPFLDENFALYRWQVPLYNRVIDCAAIDKEDNLVGIEFKLKNWKRALEQAQKNANAFDYIYVCLPNANNVDKVIRAADESGIGVLIFHFGIEEVKVELPASKIKRQWQPNVNYMREFLSQRGKIDN